jgi:hypothetical protein
MEQHLNCWLLVDLTDYTNVALTTFFSIVDGSTEYNALTKPKQLVLKAYWQANPERVYKSKLTAKKYLVYVHFPESLANELRALPASVTDHIGLAGLSLRSLSTAIHEEYLTGAGQGRVILDADEVGYDKDKNFRFYNVFAGVQS